MRLGVDDVKSMVESQSASKYFFIFLATRVAFRLNSRSLRERIKSVVTGSSYAVFGTIISYQEK